MNAGCISKTGPHRCAGTDGEDWGLHLGANRKVALKVCDGSVVSEHDLARLMQRAHRYAETLGVIKRQTAGESARIHDAGDRKRRAVLGLDHQVEEGLTLLVVLKPKGA